MSKTGYGTAANSAAANADPNILSLKDTVRIRLLEGKTAYRQHYIEDQNDPEKGRFVICPRGANGTIDSPCPLCIKPVDEKGKQRFAISRRYAANVWDYGSGSVKVLIGGPQIFKEFDSVADMGMDPTQSDFMIAKVGTGITTKYSVVRGGEDPLPVQITTDMLHSTDKYADTTSVQKIFEILEELGWDYDNLTLPSFTLEEAEAFVWPYGKHKGSTIEQTCVHDRDYAMYMHGVKKDQESYGDPVFLALQAVLQDGGFVPPLENVDKLLQEAASAPTPAAVPAPATPAPVAAPAPAAATPDLVTLIGPDGAVEVPSVAVDAMLQAGFSYPDPPKADEPESSEVTLVGPDGTEVTVPTAAAEALMSAGFKPVSYSPDPEPEFQFPADDEMVQFKLAAVPNPIPLAFADCKRLAGEGQGAFVDDELGQQVAALAPADPAPSAPEPAPVQPAATGDPLDPDLTVGPDVDGKFSHPAIENGTKKYAGKGGVTAALNRLRKQDSPEKPHLASVPDSVPAEGVDGKREQAQTLLSKMPSITDDFSSLLALFDEVAGKRNIAEFTEADLDKLIVKLTEMQAVAV